jgi:hypothetical protein
MSDGSTQGFSPDDGHPDAPPDTDERRPRSRFRSIASAVFLAVGIGFSIAAFAVNATASPQLAAKAQCRINFSASSLHLRIGQDLVLTWTSLGADKLSASWTSSSIPFAGAVTTTMNRAGTFSYQITGTLNGSYCGGAGVEVNFAGAAPSHEATSSTAPNPAPGGHSGNGGHQGNGGNGGNGGSGNGGNGTGTGGGGNNGGNGGNGTVVTGNGGAGGGSNGVAAGNTGRTTGRHGGKYPAQSPTGGSGVSFMAKPLNLLGVGGLAFLLSLALWKREKIRAPFVHQH